MPWAGCERVYAPALDMEEELRKRGLPMFALESKDSLDQFDGIGFTLQSELTHTNILNIIDLSGIPLRTKDRTEAHPLTFAGGPAVFNPEPLSPFMDFFVIGDGEDAIVEIANLLRRLKAAPRRRKLEALSMLEGVYVPALYPFDTLENGSIVPSESAPKILKRLKRDLNGAKFPTDYIVPFTKQVHDRVSLEVLRGCTQGCRFCQAGMTTRPVRERSIEKVEELMNETLDKTGYEEVSLVSLSTCDHSRVRQLVENTAKTARKRRVAVSLPSLRLDSFSVDLSDMVSEERRSGLTFAPEAASPRLRSVINKWIPDEELLEMSSQAYAKGWEHVKLYFMIGLPTERDEDIEAIADLCHRTLNKGRKIKPTVRVNLGVSTFVPKPFTPFQWAEQINHVETTRRQRVLRQALGRDRSIKFGRHEPEETYLEGLVSRGDRRAGDLLEAAFKKGCRLDAWREHLRFDLWEEAIEEIGYDVEFALRERDPDERLPWDHIDVMIPKAWFLDDWQRALELKHAQDCRHKRCHKCGVIDVERELCAHMLRSNIEGRKSEAKWEKTPVPERVEPPPVQRMRFRISREGPARYLSHLESMNSWIRALRRVNAPISYSQGFHPHPKISFSAANPVGYASRGDYMDVILTERLDPGVMAAAMNETLSDGFAILGAVEMPLKSPALMSLTQGVQYTVLLRGEDVNEVTAKMQTLMSAQTLEVERRVKVRKRKKFKRYGRPKTKTVDIRPLIRSASVNLDGIPSLEVELVTVDGVQGKMKEILPMVLENPALAHVLKRDTLIETEGLWASLSNGWPETEEASVHVS
jgi:radical SAM family uncharacterized protein/radical SAM-linked protein